MHSASPRIDKRVVRDKTSSYDPKSAFFRFTLILFLNQLDADNIRFGALVVGAYPFSCGKRIKSNTSFYLNFEQNLLLHNIQRIFFY